MKCKALIFISAIVFPLTILSSNMAYGAANYNVNATIRISACGNGVVEGGEDCDGMDIHGKTCQNLKFGDGTLSCDISCSFDTSQCIAATPTPTPPPVIAQTIGSIITSAATSPAPTISFSSVLFPTRTPKSILPPALRIFDINGSGHITASELPDILKIWILAWKNYSYEIKDLSVLLYYVNR